MTNEIKKNEISKIDFAKLINDMIIKIDSFVDENVAKNVNIVIIAFDIKRNIIDANVAIDVIFVNSFDINIVDSFDKNIAISFANFSIFF